MNSLKPYKNKPGTYAIIDLRTEEVLKTFRLKAAAVKELFAYSFEQRKGLEIRRVK